MLSSLPDRVRIHDHDQDDLDRLLAQALKLPPAARAALAGSLLDSLDADADEELEEAWSTELARRIESIDRGAELLVPWSEARRRILAEG